MIYTKKQNISRYLGLNPSLDTAIQYLQTADLSKLHKGHNSISGDNVFVNRFDYETIPEYEGSWEGHVQYGDIHIMISGNEKIGVSSANELLAVSYNETTDFVAYKGPVNNWYPMGADDVLIVFPEDVHMVKIQQDESAPVIRAVVKFLL